MSIDIDKLEKSMLVIFQHLREKGIESVEFEHDFYWSIEKEQRYDPYRQPTQLTLGQLTNDWDEIEKIASGEAEVIGYALVWAAALIRYLGEKFPS